MNEYHWTPQMWADLSMREKALVVAGVELRIEEEKRQKKDAERKARRRR